MEWVLVGALAVAVVDLVAVESYGDLTPSRRLLLHAVVLATIGTAVLAAWLPGPAAAVAAVGSVAAIVRIGFRARVPYAGSGGRDA